MHHLHRNLFPHSYDVKSVLDVTDLEEWRAHSTVLQTYITPLPIGFPFRVTYGFNKKSSKSTFQVYDLDVESLSAFGNEQALFLTPKGTVAAYKPLTEKTIQRVLKRLPQQVTLDLEYEWPRTIDVYLVLTAGAGPRRDETFATHSLPHRKQLRWEEDEVPEQMVFPCWRKIIYSPDEEPDQQKWLRNRSHVYIYAVDYRNKAGISRSYMHLHPSHITSQMHGTFSQEQYSGGSIYPVDLTSFFSVDMFCQNHKPDERIGHRVMLTNPAARGCSNLFWSSSWFRPILTQEHKKHGKVLVQPAKRIRFK